MKRIIVIISILSLAFMVTMCYSRKEVENRIMISNRFSQDIYIIPNYVYDEIEKSINSRSKFTANEGTYFVQSSTNGRILLGSLCIKEYWDYYVKSDTLTLYVYDKYRLENENWLHLDSILLKKYKITYNKLVLDSCTVIIK